MMKMQGSKKRSTKLSWRLDYVKRVKTDPESRAREKLRESFSERLQRRATESNLRKMTEQNAVAIFERVFKKETQASKEWPGGS